MVNEQRLVEAFRHGRWVEIPFASIKIGDKVRLFDMPERALVVWDGQAEFYVYGEPYLNYDGAHEVKMGMTPPPINGSEVDVDIEERGSI